MRLLQGDDLKGCVQNFTYEKKQLDDPFVYLTVAGVARVTGIGQVDFGGSEWHLGAREALQPEKASDEETYGWWHLGPGAYIITFNETITLPDGALGFVEPSERITRNGTYHPTVALPESDDALEVLLIVSPPGIDIKENARISRLYVMSRH